MLSTWNIANQVRPAVPCANSLPGIIPAAVPLPLFPFRRTALCHRRTALLAIVIGIGAIAGLAGLYRSSPELDRVVASRQLQARATQASEQLVEKTKGMEATQQESIDQLQVVQDQLQTVRRLLAAQQADSKSCRSRSQR